MPTPSGWRVLLPLGLGTALSLMGDATLYTVLPTHTAAAGITLDSVGLMLSANRWIRLITNHTAGSVYDRWSHRWFFVGALTLGALSTVMCAFRPGFWPLLIARLLWGLAWSGIWIGGNTIILDVASPEERGRWTGFYQLSFYLGSTLGFLLSGALTDWLGYQPALIVAAIVNLSGAVIAFLFLPETQGRRIEAVPGAPPPALAPQATQRDPLASATALYMLNRFVTAGIISTTLSLLVKQRFSEIETEGNLLIGVSTLTGILFGVSTLTSMIAAPIAGHWSDRIGNRWRVAAGGLLPGVLGAACLAIGNPFLILIGVPLSAIAGGSSQSLATAILGDHIGGARRSRALGWMHTFGDLSSAIAPPLAYSLLAWIDIPGIYILCVVPLCAMLGWSLILARQ
jgi:MFS family permease